MTDENRSRRDSLRDLGLITAGAMLLPLISCSGNGDKTVASGVAPNPFLIPARPTLAAGNMGGDMRTIIRASQTNNQFSCVEAVISAKKIAGAPHKHDDLDELMYVTQGTASVLLGDEVVEVPAGSWHLRPRGIVHVVWNSGDEDLRLIDMYFNQNFEDYLEEVYHQILPEVARRNISFDEPEIAKRIAALDKKLGLTYYPEKLEPLLKKYGLS